MKALKLALAMICTVLVIPLGACGGSSSTSAPVPVQVLDQDSGVTTGSLSPVSDNADRAQTYTVGETGLLSRISLLLSEPMPAGAQLVIDVRNTTNGVPNESDAINNVWFTLGLPTGALSTVPKYVNFDVGQYGIHVTAGQVLAIVLRSPGGASTGYDWPIQGPGLYPGGASFHRIHNGTNLWTESVGDDFGFRTYVTR